MISILWEAPGQIKYSRVHTCTADVHPDSVSGSWTHATSQEHGVKPNLKNLSHKIAPVLFKLKSLAEFTLAALAFYQH